MKIDVVLLTKNSLQPCLKECVDSIYQNLPVNRLIVVDGGSTDGTLELLRGYPDVDFIDDSVGTRATARQKGIEAVITDWHVHVDSDVILSADWFNKAWANVTDSTGAVWGAAVPSEKHFYNINYAMSKLYRMDMKALLVKQMRGERCMMHDTLIRTAAVQDIRIPPNLHIYEDDFIGRYIIRKGYRFLKVPSPYCLHNLTPNERFTGFITTGYLLNKYRYGRFSQILRWVATSFPKSAWIYIVTRDFQASKIHFLSNVLILKGWLAA
ncbi:MAG: glycosyltransferase family 2 protein [Candidatus Bathyarchaeota archaeon]|nr:glycosyltransferase family 2 protein [Candidatus Bathyarchaeota archaeon]